LLLHHPAERGSEEKTEENKYIESFESIKSFKNQTIYINPPLPAGILPRPAFFCLSREGQGGFSQSRLRTRMNHCIIYYKSVHRSGCGAMPQLYRIYFDLWRSSFSVMI
jgi:hypothetical protein